MHTGSAKRGMFVVLAIAVAGCGGGSSSGGGGGTFTTSVSGSKPLASLTDADKTQLCKDVGTFTQSSAFTSSECKVAGFLAAGFEAAFDDTISDAMLQASCNAAVASCKNGGGDAGAGSGGMMGVCDTSKPLPANCTATVAEFSACVNELPKSFDNVPACSSVTRASLNSDAGAAPSDPTSGAACAALDAKCPGILSQ